MSTYAANTVMAASEASAVGCNQESGCGAGGGAAQAAQQHASDSLPFRGSSVGQADAMKLRHRRAGGNLATIALVVAVLAFAVAVSR